MVMAMHEYVVEDMQIEEQVDNFYAENIEDAVYILLDQQQFIDLNLKNSAIEIKEHSAYITISLPYGVSYVYEIGEVGKR
jgi:hypothetical protein